MRLIHIFYSFFIISLVYLMAMVNSGCGQIGMPTGGPRDSIPPRMINASPELNSTNITGNKITLSFNEYVELRDAQTNVLISPYPKKNPEVDYKLKTVTLKLKDTLLPNTTYSINFGSAIVDINEGNPLKDFTYVFSTGDKIDTFMFSGKVLLAENGKTDSTLIAMLYRNADDSAVQKRKPDYVSKLRGDGSFLFVNLPADNFKVYALKDEDGSKTYNAKKEMFAFADFDVSVSENTDSVLLFASALEKEKKQAAAKSSTPAKKLSIIYPPGIQLQDLLSPFELSFNNPLKVFDTTKLILKDTNNLPVPSASWSIDSSRTIISLAVNWEQEKPYILVIDTSAISDSADNHLAKQDTVRFVAKKQADYGSVVLRFSNLDLTKDPVLQFVQGETVKESYPLSSSEWKKTLMNPGEYEIRILFDENKNGIWDPGNYAQKKQPEKVITLNQKLPVKANWDNERDIIL